MAVVKGEEADQEEPLDSSTFGFAGEGGLEDDAGDQVVPAAYHEHVERRAFDAFVTLSAGRPVSGSVAAAPCGLTPRYPVERWPPSLGSAQRA